MSRFHPEEYEPEDGLSVVGLPILLTVLGAASVGLGWLASFIGQWHYLLVIFPIGIGIGLVFVGNLAGHLAKMRSQSMAMVLGTASALVATVSLHYFDYRHFLDQRPELLKAAGVLDIVPAGINDPNVEEARKLVSLAKEVNSYGSYLNYEARQGVSISFRESKTLGFNIGFIGTWIYWVLEFVAIAYLATKGLNLGARAPFCSDCDEWKEERLLGRLKRKGFNVAIYVRNGEIDRLKEHISETGGGNLILSAAVCPTCQADSNIVVKLVEIRKNKKGQKEEKELAQMTYPGKALAEFEELFMPAAQELSESEITDAESEMTPAPAAEQAEPSRPGSTLRQVMPSGASFACPGCRTVMKSDFIIPAGKKIKCRKCGTIFRPDDASAEPTIPFKLSERPRRSEQIASRPIARPVRAPVTESDDDDEEDFEPSSRHNFALTIVLVLCAVGVFIAGVTITAAQMSRTAGKAKDQVGPPRTELAPVKILTTPPERPALGPDLNKLPTSRVGEADAPVPSPFRPRRPAEAKTIPQPTAPSAPRVPLSDADAAAAFIDLRSPNASRRRAAAARISRVDANPARRAEIAMALEPLLADPDTVTRMSAAGAMKKWAIRENGPALINAVNDDNALVRWGAIEALGMIKEERAADVLVKRWTDAGDQRLVTTALQAIGPAVEKIVLPYLEDPNWHVRVQACKVLQEVGTNQCIPALEMAQKDSHRSVSRAAGEALKALAARKE